MKSNLKYHLELHFIVLIYGTTAILGKLISLPAEMVVGWRMIITVAALSLLVWIKKENLRISKQHLTIYSLVGVIVAIHWFTFFHAIKISNVSVALGGLASTTLFASILEPIVTRRKFRLMEMVIGLFIIAGLYLIFRFETRYVAGLLTALSSAFLAALFTVMNKRIINNHPHSPLVVTQIEMGAGALLTVLFLIFTRWNNWGTLIPGTSDWFWLCILALACTVYPYIATIGLMKHLSAYNVTLAVNMEPVYGIIMAFYIFGQSEMMTAGFYAGTAVILISVFIYPFLKKKE